MARMTRIAAVGAIVALGLSTAGCFSLPRPPVETTPGTEESLAATPEPTDGGFADAFAERDAFIEAQGLPLDGSLLVAVTPEQKELIRQQKEYVESQGATWTPQDESTTLALSADACETSILNEHELDAMLFQTHVTTSPLVTAILESVSAEQRPAAERNVISLAVFGTQFLCPDDAPQWQAAFDEVYAG